MAHLVVDPAIPTVPPAWATPAAGTAAIGGTAPMRYVIVSVPAAARPVDHQAVTAMVSRAVVEVIAEAPVQRAGDTATEPDLSSSPADDLPDAVVAAHDARIAILRRRLAVLREASAPIGDLAARLHRAEAARSLALARLSGSGPALTDAPVIASPRANNDQGPTARLAAAPVRAAVMPKATAAWTAGGSYRPARRRAVVHNAGSGWRPSGASATIASLQRPATSIRHGAALAAAPNHPATGLAAARRSLARARAALGAPPLASPPRPALAIAGLWRWDGSETWRLRSDRV